MTQSRFASRPSAFRNPTTRRAFRRRSCGCGAAIPWRYVSATPQPKRELPGIRKTFGLSRWQRGLGAGLLAGLLGSLAYAFHFNEQSQDVFVPYKLVDKVPVSSTASIFLLEPPETSHDLDIYKKAWHKGIWNVHVKQPQLQIVRPYTPLPIQSTGAEEGTGSLKFLIRNDVNGEVSSWLHRLPIGSEIELRGPNLEYEISREAKQVVFFAGGTGIAPALQVAHALFNSEDGGKDRNLHILWANRKREDCTGGHGDFDLAEPPTLISKLTGIFVHPRPAPSAISPETEGLIIKELKLLKQRHPGQVTVEYFVNEENTWLNSAAVSRALRRFHHMNTRRDSSSPMEQRQILISGPDGFIDYLAGPKEWRNGKEQQGGISNILAQALSVNPHNVKIWKI